MNRTKIVLALIAHFWAISAFTQNNIVINGSGESFANCPSSMGDFQANNISNPTDATIDYFNSCNPSTSINFLNDNVGQPSNCVGYQKAKDGVAYFGITCLFDG